MTRIISGTAGGRRLSTPTGSDTRPTADRVREGLFSRLEHLGVVTGARVLDLYAGSGALGLEAASRGARRVVLVEADRNAAAVARANAQALGLADRVVVRVDTVERHLLGRPDEPFGLVVADPPYALGEARLADVLALLVTHEWLGAEAVVVVERSGRSGEPHWPAGLVAAGERRYGDTKVWFAEVPRPEAIA